ncbi:TlpA family protein disulfide reductase [Reyranella sp.]|uniref:TlpA family protein disulfide reductase n=1 Tax=Reyranella sp. TaxID=1929291 RepID=UPI003BAB01EF
MKRRALLFAVAPAVLLPGAAQALQDLKVVYIGGLDCPPCRRWKQASLPDWLASPEYRRVAWIEVEAPKLREAYQERYWPGDLRPILDQLPRRGGTPRFLIVKDGRVVANEFGSSKWTAIVTELKNLLGE